MVDGLRNSFVNDDWDGWDDGNPDNFGVSRIRRKRSRKKVNKARKRHSRKMSYRKRGRRAKHSRKGKRPYPHWLKKYWFKKKR